MPVSDIEVPPHRLPVLRCFDVRCVIKAGGSRALLSSLPLGSFSKDLLNLYWLSAWGFCVELV